MAHPSEPLPLFSPTQASSGSEDAVLHSIFSPNFQGGITSLHHHKREKHDVEKRERQKRERIAQASKRVVPKTPSTKRVSIIDTRQSSKPLNSPRDEFFSPNGCNDAPFIPATLSKTGLKTPANLARSAFHSPRYSPDFASPGAFSTISALTTASSCSFKSIPIDMLSFEYVSNCESPEALQQIVDTLSADGSKHYPSLLKKAKQQLYSIQEQLCVQNNTIPSVRFTNMVLPVPKDSALYVSSTKDESSLALSLSSSLLDEASAAEVPTETKVPSLIPLNTSNKKVVTTSDQSNHAEGRCNSGSNAVHTATSVSPDTDVEIEKDKLLSKVERLSEEIHTLSLFQHNASELQHELKVLKHAKAEAKNKVAALEKAVLSSSQHAREANEALAKVREESRFLKELLSDEQDAARSKINEAKVIEQGLRRKIQMITAQLAECKQDKAVAAQSMEARLRSQIEKEYTKQDGDVRRLRESLKNAQTTLYAMQTERTSTLRSIHQALGKPTDGVEHLSPMERKVIVDSISKKLITSQSTIQALSKVLTEAKIKAKRAAQARDAAKKQVDALNSKCRSLEQENQHLTKQIKDLSDEHEKTKAYVDSLLQQKDESEEWQSRESDYKEIISNLKAQVRSGESTVSLAFYRKAVDEARARAIECQDKRLEINIMSRKIQALEERLKKDKLSSIETKASPPEIRPSRSNLRKVTPTSSVKSDERSNANNALMPKVEKTSSSKSAHPPPPPTPRMSALREAGGRAGLYAKLKHMRRSPLVNKNQCE